MHVACWAGLGAARPSPNRMATKLDKPLKRELEIGGEAYTLTLTPEGLKLVKKGHRLGLELAWQTLVNGEAALATALNASLQPPAE
jgi:hypothetical protein